MENFIGGVTLFLVIVVLLFFFFIFLKKRNRVFADKELQYIKSHWIRIIDMFHSHPKEAVLDADKLLDYALSKKGYEGSLGEKLKKAGKLFSDINDVWMAHKVRNAIAHEMVEIEEKDFRAALHSYKRALNDLGAKLGL
ncbi:MAG: hypothetical protein WC651_00820 [Candidatus Gracilibacteria bacterium]